MNEREWEQFESRAARAADPSALRELRKEAAAQASEAFAGDAPGTLALVNRMHDAVIRRSLAIAEERVRTSRTDAPPVSSFAVMLFGSGGRREQTLWSDQDNGIVYETADGAEPPEAESYMAQLAAAFRGALEEAGYPPCDGGVIVTNPVWRRPLEEWKRTVAGWVEEPVFETVRYALILADARAVYGDAPLAASLKGELAGLLARRREVMLPRMLQNTLRRKMLVGVLGNLLTERYGEDTGGIDIKYGAYLPMVNAVRLLALAHGVGETGTLGRIGALADAGAVNREDARQWAEAFGTILKFRAMTPVREEGGTWSSRGILPAAALTSEVRKELKRALRVGAELQRRLTRLIGAEGRG